MNPEPPQNAGDKAHNDYLKDSKRNKYCSGQKASSDLYSEGYDVINWDDAIGQTKEWIEGWLCEVCGKWFDGEDKLDEHRLEIHNRE